MQNGAVVRRRVLGRQLRLLRERAGFTLEVAAPELDWSSSKLSRIEMGQQAVDVHGVRSMLTSTTPSTARPTTGGAVHGDDTGWRTSSFSGSNGDSCVEVAFLPDAAVAVRDTKDRSLAPHRYSAAGWAAFAAGVRAGEFERA